MIIEKSLFFFFLQNEDNINVSGTGPLRSSILNKMLPSEQKQMLGERLFVFVQQIESNLAVKITGMFLELDTKYFLILIKSHEALKAKI
jgi:polyadenylate-binding protein